MMGLIDFLSVSNLFGLKNSPFYPNKMEEFWILILVGLFATNLEKAESVKVKLEETPLKTFDEIFGEGWWDKDEAEDLKRPLPTNFRQNFHHQIDRQNTQIGQIEPNSTDQLGQIEPNSTDQLGQIEPNSTDQLGQIEPNSTDQNPPLSESDHSVNAKNGEKLFAEDVQKHKTVAKELGLSFKTIYNWKKELGQTTAPNHKYSHSEQKELMKRYYEIKDKNPKINGKGNLSDNNSIQILSMDIP
uniref:Uncharacterized protein n=1 Tax=Globodera rostochiensis TaxID=31243 RepID=A0A914HRU4_GLORO